MSWFRLETMPNFEVGNQETQQNRGREQRVQGLDRNAERTATLTLFSCALLLLPLLLTFFSLKITKAYVTNTYDPYSRNSFVLVQDHNPYSPTMMHSRFYYSRYKARASLPLTCNGEAE